MTRDAVALAMELIQVAGIACFVAGAFFLAGWPLGLMAIGACLIYGAGVRQ